jgi:hypothetical protein
MSFLSTLRVAAVLSLLLALWGIGLLAISSGGSSRPAPAPVDAADPGRGT